MRTPSRNWQLGSGGVGVRAGESMGLGPPVATVTASTSTGSSYATTLRRITVTVPPFYYRQAVAWQAPRRVIVTVVRLGEIIAEHLVIAPGETSIVDAVELDRVFARRDTLAAEIEEVFLAHPLGELISTMPGIGPRTGSRILAEIGDGTRFADGHKLKRTGIVGDSGVWPLVRRRGRPKCSGWPRTRGAGRPRGTRGDVRCSTSAPMTRWLARRRRRSATVLAGGSTPSCTTR
jgi:hypothetical protein